MEEFKDSHLEEDVIHKKEKILKKVRALSEVNPMLGHRGVRLGITYPEIYSMQIQAMLEAAALCAKEGIEVYPEIMVPQVATVEELRRIHSYVKRIHKVVELTHGINVGFKFGSMLEVVRACLRAGRMAEDAEFFSFGTNDLTQATFSFSREDAENKFLPAYIEAGILQDNPFEVLDQKGVGELMKHGRDRGPQDPARTQDRHLRRTWRPSGIDPFLPQHRPDLRFLFRAARADRPSGGGAGAAAGNRRRGDQERLISEPTAAQGSGNAIIGPMDDSEFMGLALDLAREAATRARCRSARWWSSTGKCVGRGFNQPIGRHDPDRPCRNHGPARCRHAARQLPAARLHPVRDAGALRHVRRRDHACAHRPRRVRRARSQDRRGRQRGRPVRRRRASITMPTVVGGVLAEECGALLSGFFAARRGRTPVA